MRRSLISCVVVMGSGMAVTAATLPEGMLLEVRINEDTGTRISRQGDAVSAALIAPVVVDGTIVLPAGARLEGYVATAKKLGWNPFRHTATLEYRFDRVVIDGWLTLPVETRLVTVDTAREKVDSEGRVHGIRPVMNVSSGLAAYGWRLMIIEPVVGLGVWATKFAFARPPDPEIYFPKGSELLLRVMAPISLPSVAGGPAVKAIAGPDSHRASAALKSLPGPRATTRSGQLADVLNIIVLGSEQNVRTAFLAAGWAETEKNSVGSMMRTYRSIVERRPYRSAPMSVMKLEDDRPQLSFQKSLNSFARRHHIRLWRRPTPEGEAWIGAATEDISIGFSFKKMNWTHFIDMRIDSERSKVANDLAFTGCVEASSYLERSELPNEFDHDSGPIQTDGRVAVMKLGDCPDDAVGASQVQPRKPHTIKRILSGAHDELVRSNILFVSYNATKLASAVSHFWTKRLIPHRTTSLKNSRLPSEGEDIVLFTALPEGLHEGLVAGSPPDAAAAVPVPGSLEPQDISEGPGRSGERPDQDPY